MYIYYLHYNKER